nr:PHP domain-containing protein [uncultured Desulfuromonas sp.]
MTEHVDFHTHSTCSDGAFSPQELIEKAAQNRVVAMALCDHDNIDGVEPARKAGHLRGIDVISGVELSCVWKGFEDIHLLGYGFNPEHSGLQQELRDFQQFRRQRNALIVEKINDRLSQRGLQPICYEKVAERAGGTIGRPHIAMELMAAGYAQSVEDAFVKYLTPCNIAKKFFPVDQAMALIRDAGGVAVLAHPPYISRDYSVMAALLDELSAMGMQGVEVYNNGANCDEIEWYLTQVRLRGLFATGGSDFHGIEDGGAELGKIRAIGGIPYHCYTTLREVLA